MSNCVAADVRLIIDTSLTDANIGSLITLADAEMTARGLDEGSSNIKKLISMLITASLISMRDPVTKSIGEYTEAKLNAEGWRKLAEDHISGLVEIPFLAITDPVE